MKLQIYEGPVAQMPKDLHLEPLEIVWQSYLEKLQVLDNVRIPSVFGKDWGLLAHKNVALDGRRLGILAWKD